MKVGRILLTFLLSFVFTPLASANSPSNAPVLYIGDSISYVPTESDRVYFGPTLFRALSGYTENLTYISLCGAIPENFINPKTATQPTNCGYFEQDPNLPTINFPQKNTYASPTLQSKLKANPKLTIVALGTNIATAYPYPGAAPTGSSVRPNPADTVDTLMREIKRSGSQCLWILPANVSDPSQEKKILATRAMIRREAHKPENNCALVEALVNSTAPTDGDGIHPDPSLGVKWANSIIDDADFKNALQSAVMAHSLIPVKTTAPTAPAYGGLKSSDPAPAAPASAQ